MFAVRKSNERGHTDIDWLNSWHTFSFGDYYDPKAMGFRVLRVINDDRVAAGGGFPTHAHRDMEIVTYVLDGALEHKDSLGTGSVIRPGDVQRMSAGTGVRHSEFNASRAEPVHFLQIWILPRRAGLKAAYEQKTLPLAAQRGRLILAASPEGKDDAVAINQDASLYVARLDANAKVHHEFATGRYGYLHVARGPVTVAGHNLDAGDGVAFSDEAAVEITGRGDSEILLFDLP